MEKITLNNGTTLIIKEVFWGWEVTTEENYKAIVNNARDVMKFMKRDFGNIGKVKEYLMGL